MPISIHSLALGKFEFITNDLNSHLLFQCTVLKVQTADKAVFMSLSQDKAVEPDVLEINGLYATRLGIDHGDQVRE
jgi:hypothetical protein